MTSNTHEFVILGGGCFWCLEAIFIRVHGVAKVTPGYAGGTKPNPTYEEVCTGKTGHAEVVRVEFDPQKISFEEILEIFFALHDPTTPNRQGADIGTQYRSIIIPTTESQKKIAEDTIAALNTSKKYSSPVVTVVDSHTPFYEAEPYHHTYYDANRSASYCRLVIDPKITHFYKKFESLATELPLARESKE